MSSTIKDLQAQWANPSDILSLLLLIGGDIVQKAIAQLIGLELILPGRRGARLSIAPVAFSFGWVAYSFTNLLAAFGDKTLMPVADHPCITVNCANGFVRETRSWVLGRLLRNHEITYPVDQRPEAEGGRAESIRIDIFHLGPVSRPTFDVVWWSGWATLAGQVALASIPWALYGDWGAMLIMASGVFLMFVACAMPQWIDEKWAGRKLEKRKQKVMCLTRGNGHGHILVLVGFPGSWDLETLATGVSSSRPETRWLSLALAIAWTCLLITISGLKEHTWFLVAIGAIGMVQNTFAASAVRMPDASRFHIEPFPQVPTIIGHREPSRDIPDPNSIDELAELEGLSRWLASDTTDTTAEPCLMPRWLNTMSKEDGVPTWLEAVHPAPSSCASFSKTPGVINTKGGVHGALMELEKWVPTAGLAMVQVFFPGGLIYNDSSIRNNDHKKFWKKAHNTAPTRRKAVEKKRALEREAQSRGDTTNYVV